MGNIESPRVGRKGWWARAAEMERKHILGHGKEVFLTQPKQNKGPHPLQIWLISDFENPF